MTKPAPHESCSPFLPLSLIAFPAFAGDSYQPQADHNFGKSRDLLRKWSKEGLACREVATGIQPRPPKKKTRPLRLEPVPLSRMQKISYTYRPQGPIATGPHS